jgi:hypothetical protein
VVGVLILVDQDVTEPSTVMLSDLRESLQHRDRLPDQVVEVERVGHPQPVLVLGVDGSHRARQVVGVVRVVGSDRLATACSGSINSFFRLEMRWPAAAANTA